MTKKLTSETEEEIKAFAVADIELGEIKIKCAVLTNEKRVFFQRNVLGALTGNKKGGIERYFGAKNIQPFLPKHFRGERWDSEIIKFRFGGVEAHAIEATDLIDICNIYIQAQNAGVLHKSQQTIARNASIIMNAFAKTGVVAVIDEATGYQRHRKKDALRLLVKSYVDEEAKKWMKEFPDEFFIELDRIYKNPKTTPNKRPRYYANFINTYIYKPIENGLVFEKLDELNPTNKKGYRKRRLHQFLNEVKGKPVLRNRIGKVTALLQISPNKRRFVALFNRMESKQMYLNLPEDD